MTGPNDIGSRRVVKANAEPKEESAGLGRYGRVGVLQTRFRSQGGADSSMHQAISVGALVPENAWNGSLHSRFERFINLTHPEGFLITVTSDRSALHGYCVFVSESCLAHCEQRLATLASSPSTQRSTEQPEMPDPTAARRAGAPAEGSTIDHQSDEAHASERLRGRPIGGDRTGVVVGGISIRFDQAVHYSGTVSSISSWSSHRDSGRIKPVRRDARSIARVITDVVKHRKGSGKSGEAASLESVFRQRIEQTLQTAAAHIASIQDSIAGSGNGAPAKANSQTRKNAPPDLSPIIGVGEGLTPAGDDYIAGAILGETLFPPEVGIDRASLRSSLDRTSPPGRTLLMGVLSGVFPFHAFELGRAICDPQADLALAVARTVEHGASSGSDLCLGLAWRLRS